MRAQDRPALADRHERGYAGSALRLRAEVMREPRDNDADGRVRPAGDAKYGKIPCVGIGRHDQHDQVSDRAEETRAGNDETASLQTIREVRSAAKHDGGDCIRRNGEELGERIGCATGSINVYPASKKVTHYIQRS